MVDSCRVTNAGRRGRVPLLRSNSAGGGAGFAPVPVANSAGEGGGQDAGAVRPALVLKGLCSAASSKLC